MTADVEPRQFGQPVDSIDTAIAEDARLAAIEVVVEERRKAIKSYLEAKTGRVPGYAHTVDGEGKVTVTNPNRKPVVVDDAAWRAWAFQQFPERTTSRPTVDAAVVERALAGDHGEDTARRLADLLDTIPGAVESVVHVDEKLLDSVAKQCTHHTSEDTPDLIRLRTGDGEIVPGVELRWASQATLRVAPDADRVTEYAEAIRAALAPVPALTSGDSP